MSIKNNIKLLVILVFNFFIINFNISAEELNITASEIEILNDNKLLIAKGSVKIIDSDGNILETDKAEYDKTIEQVTTYKNSKIVLINGYEISSSKIVYDNKNKFIFSNNRSYLKDSDGNHVTVNMFEYQIEKFLFSSKGEIKIKDKNNNKYYFSEMYIDTKNRKIVGSEVRVSMDKKAVGLSDENDPRFVANSIFISENESDFYNGVFTTCKRRGNKCPPWTLEAKKITHDKLKKTIYYDDAVLKIYDVPIFYFPKFFHPDPTVKRQSGFLIPFFTDNTSVGTGFALPYYWAISNDKDLTFTPKIYSNHKSLLLAEYRQAFENSFLHLDTGYTQGYNDTSSTKTAGSRNHIFGKFISNLSKDLSYTSKLFLDFKKVSNDTFFRIHDVNTALVNSAETDLKSEISYKFKKDNLYFDASGTVYENLRESSNKRYEYILPNIEFGNNLFTSAKFGILDFSSRAYGNNYDVNKTNKYLINNFFWKSKNFFTGKGLINNFEGQFNNTNYKSKNTSGLRGPNTVKEISGMFAFRSKLPMKKESENFTKTLVPNFMLRYSPNHMRDLSDEDVTLNYSNLLSGNKTSVIESGLSAVLAVDYTVNDNKSDDKKEKFKFSVGQVFRPEYEFDMPSKSSLEQKMSDIVGEAKYNLTDNSRINYKFSLDHNISTVNYHEISSRFNFGKIDFNLDYLEERNFVGNENYINTGITLNFNESSALSFKTKKNYKTESTEFYNLVYQYKNDCLAAGIEFNRNFYTDRDVEPADSLMFKISFIPFGGITSPSILRE